MTGFYKKRKAWLKWVNSVTFNPLSANPTKWSNTLKQFELLEMCLTVL